jgi:hypothetical protein
MRLRSIGRQDVPAAVGMQDRQSVTTHRAGVPPITLKPLCSWPDAGNHPARQEYVIILTVGYADPLAKQESPVRLAAAVGSSMNLDSRIGGGAPA